VDTAHDVRFSEPPLVAQRALNDDGRALVHLFEGALDAFDVIVDVGQIGERGTLGAEHIHISPLVLQSALPQNLDERVVDVWPLPVAECNGHVECRAVTAREETGKV